MASIARTSINFNGGTDYSAMDLSEEQLIEPQKEQNQDAFLQFIDYARSVLSPIDEDEAESSDTEEREREGPGWSWIASRVLKTCISYSSGVTVAILLSELSQAWNEQRKSSAPRKRPDCINQLNRKHRRAKLPNTVTIDTIYEKNFLSLDSVLEVVVVDAFVLEGTNIHMLTLGDLWSSNTIDLYLHRRYYNLASYPSNGIFKKGRELFLTGCYLRPANGGSGRMRLLPTEYLVVLLDEDQDDDAMLLAATFFTDSFSSVSLDAANKLVRYSLYARIKSIAPLEFRGNHGVSTKQITLVDNDGNEMIFLLWGDQVLLANLFSVGSMLAIDEPWISSSLESNLETCGPCLEYGSSTNLYLVPFVQQEEQVCIALTPSKLQGSKLTATSYPTQGPYVSQMTLPCDSQGSVDFSNYPFQALIMDLHDKMTGVSIYGVVTDLFHEINTEKSAFNLRIQDATGTIWAKLHFSESWSLGRLSLGHTVYISGLTCTMTKERRLEARWFEGDIGTSLVNISCLPAFLNSSCLHKQSSLADLSRQTTGTHICKVWVDQTEGCHVDTRLVHNACGHFVRTTPSGSVECEFCCCSCGTNDTRCAFHLKLTVADESGKVFVWCTGQTATELLQISPDEFCDLPEEEQAIYPCSLENEIYMVAVVNCGQEDTIFKERVTTANDRVQWEVTRALKL